MQQAVVTVMMTTPAATVTQQQVFPSTHKCAFYLGALPFPSPEPLFDACVAK